MLELCVTQLYTAAQYAPSKISVVKINHNHFWKKKALQRQQNIPPPPFLSLSLLGEEF